jgi:hypothetical protein
MRGTAISSQTKPDRSDFSEMMRRMAAMWRWPIGDKLCFALALPAIVLAAAALRLLAVRRLVWLLGPPLGAVGYIPLADAAQQRRARLIKRSIRRAATVSPWRADCLPQALTGALLCRWLAVPVASHLGVRLEGEPGIEAHAWLCSGRVAVTGGDGFGRFTSVSCFIVGGTG